MRTAILSHFEDSVPWVTGNRNTNVATSIILDNTKAVRIKSVSFGVYSGGGFIWQLVSKSLMMSNMSSDNPAYNSSIDTNIGLANSNVLELSEDSKTEMNLNVAAGQLLTVVLTVNINNIAPNGQSDTYYEFYVIINYE